MDTISVAPVIADPTDDPQGAHPDLRLLAAWVDGTATPETRASLDEHLSACADCRRLVTETAEVVDGYDAVAQPLSGPAPSRRAWKHGARIAPLAIAATLLIFAVSRNGTDVSVTSDRERDRPPELVTEERLGSLSVFAPLEGASPSVQRLAFTWSAAPVERYHFVLMTEAGTAVYTIDTRDTTLIVPDTARVQPGQAYFWHVDAVSSGVTATTGLQRLVTAP